MRNSALGCRGMVSVPCDRCGVLVVGTVELMLRVLGVWTKLGPDAALLYCAACAGVLQFNTNPPTNQEGWEGSWS